MREAINNYFSAFCILLFGCFLILFTGCSTPNVQSDDAIRIKADSVYQYIGDKASDFKTLRGAVRNVTIETTKEKYCLDSISYKYDTTVVLYNTEFKKLYRIPISHIEIKPELAPLNTFNNDEFYVESYNNIDVIPHLRKVPIERNEKTELYCYPGCRHYSLVFVELRLLGSFYPDFRQPNTSIYRAGYGEEAVFGVRMGASKDWGLGLAFSSGVQAVNSFDPNSKTPDFHPSVSLHLRYQPTEMPWKLIWFCGKPFLYAQYGLSVDNSSIELAKAILSPSSTAWYVNLKNNPAYQCLGNPVTTGVLGMPTAIAIGTGLDVWLLPSMDFSIDLSYRSQSFAEVRNLAGIGDVYQMRTVSPALFVRMGITFDF